MTSYSLDVELFIGEVQKYPELWDISCEEYRHKNRKRQAWGEVAKIFIDDYDGLSVRKKNDVSKYGLRTLGMNKRRGFFITN